LDSSSHKVALRMLQPAAEEPATRSHTLRTKGNKEYMRASQPGVAPVLREACLWRALKLYDSAIDASTELPVDPDDACAALKNRGMVNLHLSKVAATAPKRRQHTLDSLTDLTTALAQSEMCKMTKSPQWCHDLTNTIDTLAEAGLEDDILLRHMVPLLRNKDKAAQLLLQSAQNLFNESVAARDMQGYQHVLHLTRECYWPLREARKLTVTPSLRGTEIAELEESVFLQQCLAEAMQLRTVAQQRLEDALKHDEALGVPIVLACIDMLKEAAMTAQQGRAVESEAHTMCCIAEVYDAYLPWEKPRAKEYYGRAFQLCASLHPKICTVESWYKKMIHKMQGYQQEQRDAEDAAEAKEREPALKEKMVELEAIKKAFETSIKQGIEHLYQTHPPKSGCKAPDSSQDLMKNALRTAIRDYHPDKNVTNDPGQKVLCEEIIKILNSKYEVFKL